MGTEELQYIYDTDSYEEPAQVEEYIGPVLMGREREYFLRQKQAIQEFAQQANTDLEIENKKKVDTSGQLFGISAQNNNKRISLDEKFPGDIFYRIMTDNMAPYILPKTYALLKFSYQHASGEVCIYRYRGNTYCNQIKLIKGKIVAFSTNPKYKPVILDPDDYIFIAVVSSIHRALRGN